MNVASERPLLMLRQDAYVTVTADKEDRLIRLKWSGYAPSTEYRGILEDARMNVGLHQLERWLADLRGMNAILRQDEQWTVNEWFPTLAKTGLKRMAILMSSDYFNQMSVDRIMQAATPEMPFEVAYFDDAEGALAWLLASA
ncbi:MAG: STAS/SEC14 domain-containing protein [Flavobacteriales bacterium]|nr:STAS/SEC14 domain-containing protein [Flavobacteriales bacterium]